MISTSVIEMKEEEEVGFRRGISGDVCICPIYDFWVLWGILRLGFMIHGGFTPLVLLAWLGGGRWRDLETPKLPLQSESENLLRLETLKLIALGRQ